MDFKYLKATKIFANIAKRASIIFIQIFELERVNSSPNFA